MHAYARYKNEAHANAVHAHAVTTSPVHIRALHNNVPRSFKPISCMTS
jgi:hypothetical protein